MKTTLINRLAWVSSLFLAALTADLALAQSRFAPYSGTGGKSGASEESGQTSAAVVSGPNLRLSKTASVDGHEVCGAIRITNSGRQAATITGIADSLEVHFPRGATPLSLPAGSTSTWYKVADVPIPLPVPIAPGTTVTIDYCFSLCLAADFAGANSMRNVVAVTVTNASGGVRTFTTRSVSFPPPSLDCRACCKPDGSCIDTVPADCESEGGLPQSAGSDCATTECPEACCHPDDSCVDEGPSACQAAGGEPQGPGTDCTTTQCCEPLGSDCFSGSDCCGENTSCIEDTCCLPLADTGCTERSHCCEESGTVALCEDGKCCAPNRAEDSCHDTADCCDPNATCAGRTCCIPLGTIGCTNIVGNDCCENFFGAVTCEAGRCCAPTGAEDSCNVDTDCCDPNATCNGGTCCVRLAETTCGDASDCCDDGFGTVICDAGRCCAPNRTPDSCHDAADCCDANATCTGGTCCIALGDTGCTNVVGNDCCENFFGAVICEAGRCCAPTGAEDSCNVDTDCCDPAATCNGGTCCIETGNPGCEDVSDCCNDRPGMACLAEKCCVQTDVDFHSACSDDTDCCQLNATCDIHGACCIATGTTGCATDSHCCNSGATCQFGTGKCCAENSAPGACSDSLDCCDGNAICNLNSTCCVPDLRPCDQPSDCCSGLCTGGACEGVVAP